MDGPTNTSEPAPAGQPLPGQTIAPGGSVSRVVAEPAQASTPPPVTPTPAVPDPTPAPPPEPEIADPHTVANPPTDTDDPITWTASEFVAHSKGPGWFIGLALVAVLLSAGIWLLTKDTVSIAVVMIVAIMFGIYAARQPREITYGLSVHEVQIGNRRHSLGSFRSFSIVPEGAFSSIVFMPLKRFAPLTTIYYDPADENKIVDLLSASLPVDHHKKDAIDRFLWRIRF